MTSKRKDPRRQIRGAVSKAQGKRFEERLDASFAYYRERGFALIEKTPEPMRPVKSLGNGRFVAFYEKKAQPDYKGVVLGGRAVVFEAKFTGADSLEQSRVRKWQADYLEQYSKLSTSCFIIAGFSSGAVYRLPWSVWKKMQGFFGRKYITEADTKLAAYKVPVTEDGILLLLG